MLQYKYTVLHLTIQHTIVSILKWDTKKGPAATAKPSLINHGVTTPQLIIMT